MIYVHEIILYLVDTEKGDNSQPNTESYILWKPSEDNAISVCQEIGWNESTETASLLVFEESQRSMKEKHTVTCS